MPVPSSLSAVSTTAGSNSPGGSEDRTTADDYLRAYAALLKQGVTQGSDITAATNIVIPSDGLLHHITGGSTAIAGAIGGYDGRLVLLTTASPHKLTHGTNLVLPNAEDTYLQPGDLAVCKMGASYALTVLALVRGAGSVFKSAQGSDITAAAALAIPSDGLLHHITGGSTAITGAVGGYDGRLAMLTTASRHKLTHGAGLVLPDAVDTYLQPGDLAVCKMGASSALTVLALVRGTRFMFKSAETTIAAQGFSATVTHGLGYVPVYTDISIQTTLPAPYPPHNPVYISACDSNTLTLTKNQSYLTVEVKFIVKVLVP